MLYGADLDSGSMRDTSLNQSVKGLYGGSGGIRTPDTLSGTPVFKTGAINHSATLPQSDDKSSFKSRS
jgi:hypothetical protein